MSTALQVALRGLSGEHRAILEWFAVHEGEVGARPWRRDGASVLKDVSVPVVAQRGIHVPSQWSYAVSVTATERSQYGDGRPLRQDDGTWVLYYNAHSGAEGQGSGSRWNVALMRCVADRVPVGVFIPAKGQYLNLGLAMVDYYDPDLDIFVLHGPVDGSNSPDAFDFAPAPSDGDGWSDEDWQLLAREESPSLDSDERLRVQATLVRRQRQEMFRISLVSLYGKCAVTGYEAPETLEAAHILPYRGTASHTTANGLLLRADIHRLFDKHLVAVDPEAGRVRTALRLRRTRYGELEGRKLHLPSRTEDWPDAARLRLHFEVFLRAG